MSFNINLTGTRAGIAAKLATDTTVPQIVKDLVAAVTSDTGSSVKGWGHFDSTLGGNLEIKIEGLNFLQDPVVVEVPEADATAAAEATPSS